MKHLTGFVILIIVCATTQAQDTSLAKKYEQQTVFLYGSRYMVDGERLPNSGLKILLNKYADSRSEFASSQKWKTAGNVISLGSLGLMIYGVTQAASGRSYKGFFIASIVTSYISLPVLTKGKQHLHKSIWLYNKNVLVN